MLNIEAAGLTDDSRCIAIREVLVCADSHKNDDWRAYGLVVVAGFVTERLIYGDPFTGQLSTGYFCKSTAFTDARISLS